MQSFRPYPASNQTENTIKRKFSTSLRQMKNFAGATTAIELDRAERDVLRRLDGQGRAGTPAL